MPTLTELIRIVSPTRANVPLPRPVARFCIETPQLIAGAQVSSQFCACALWVDSVDNPTIAEMHAEAANRLLVDLGFELVLQ
jgi:hypothetical protein